MCSDEGGTSESGASSSRRVAAEDFGWWLLELTAPRTRPLIARQLEEAHGLAGAGLDRATSVVLDALTDRHDQTRDQLAAGPRVQRLELDGQMLILLLALSAERAQLQRSVA